jgi:hypothetical protein
LGKECEADFAFSPGHIWQAQREKWKETLVFRRGQFDIRRVVFGKTFLNGHMR